MKVSVSLPDDDVEYLDDYAHTRGLASRSAVLHRAIKLLRSSELGGDYERAWAEWADRGDDIWDAVASDGLD